MDVYKANWRLERWQSMEWNDHGTRRGYYYGCRCKECTRANRLYMQAYRIIKAREETWGDYRARVFNGGKFPWE